LKQENHHVILWEKGGELMSTNVIMPQMGESIFEGTITKWLKKEGDRVVRDEPLFEISTDKVDSEIACPGDGVLGEILVPEGTTVKIGTLLAVIKDARETPSAAGPAIEEQEIVESPGPGEPAESIEADPHAAVVTPDEPAQISSEEPASEVAIIPPSTETEPAASLQARPLPVALLPEAAPESAAVEEPKPPAAVAGDAHATLPGGDREVERSPLPAEDIRTSPLVRRIARDYGLDLAAVTGTGLSGRITRDDVFAYLERAGKMEAKPASTRPPAPIHLGLPKPEIRPPVAPTVHRVPVPPPERPAADEPRAVPTQKEAVPAAEMHRFLGETETVTMSPIRKAIAEHMVLSKRTSAHVHTVFEVDMTAVVQLREKHKDEFEAREGIKLSYTPFFVKALVDTVRDYPILNSSVSGDKIVLRKSINVGIAVALETGLIVPVIRDAQLKSFTGLSLAIHDLAERARTKRLKPEEVQQGTITVTNPGIYGSLFGTPIINQPQVAILGVGGLEKRPVVINDAIAIRSMVYLALSFDHRLIDGAVADQFMAALKARLQSWTQWVE
jgi:2-oxoglutarate dehydrogenase E2 component (dihydrolipoamide succinyltransferase)